MADTYGYTFSNMSRIGLDSCNTSQNEIMDVKSCNYITSNFFAADCRMKNPAAIAFSQPGVFINGGYETNSCAENINTNSMLKIGALQTHPKARIDLFQRPFATVPYLGRGSVNPITELQIKQGDTVTNKKSVNTLSEKSYIRYHQTPLLPVMQQKIDDSSKKIETDASEGWVRGGIPSRELTRDKDYFNKHSTFQYV
jgi:hypothetical protein